METKVENLGKVSITVDDAPWNINKSYDRLVFVKVEETGGIYMSKRYVPGGISIHNRNYWLKFGKEGNVNPDKVGEEVTGEYATNLTAPHNYAKGTIFYIDNHGESDTGIITYYVALVSGSENDRLVNTDLFTNTNVAAEALNIKLDTLNEVARSGDYRDLNHKPTNVSDFNNDEKYVSAKVQSLTSTEKQIARQNIDVVSTDAFAQALRSYINSAGYDSTNKKIKFYHVEGGTTTALAEIDTRDFIKDGMVESVVIQNSKLVITFNTDAGQQPIEINLTDIFNPANYYSKSDIDSNFYTKTYINGKLKDVDDTFATIQRVAFSGSYTDLNDKPTIPAAQVNSDWNAASGVAQILNKPTNLSAFNNDSGYVQSKALSTNSNTAISLVVTPNTIVVYSNPLTSLSITGLNYGQGYDSSLESIYIFETSSNGMTFSIDNSIINDISFANEEPSFEPGTKYIMSVWRGIIVVAERIDAQNI